MKTETKKYTCLVTGAAGFIGSHIVDELLSQGHKVVGIDNLLTGNQDNVAQHVDNPDFVFKIGNILGGEVRDLFERYPIDYIFHEAADARIPSCTNDPFTTTQTNVLGTVALLEFAKEFKVKGFAFASSSSVYGPTPNGLPTIESTSRAPGNIYGSQKLAAEEMVMKYHEFHDVPTVAFRYFNVYGTARQNGQGAYVNVFAALANAIKSKKLFKIFGSGSDVRDYIHVYDVVRANLTILDKPSDWKAWGRAYNLGTGKTTSVNKIVRMMDYKKVKHVEARTEDIPFSCASVYNAGIDLDFKARVGITKGIKIFKESHGFKR